MRALTVKQPYADLIMAGVKDIENRTWAVPSTLPQWLRCDECDYRSRNVEQCPGGGWARVPDGPFPFRLWIHAAATVDWSSEAEAAVREYGRRALGDRPWAAEAVAFMERIQSRTRVLLGTVAVTGCHHADECYGDHPTPAQFEHGVQALGHCSRWAQPDAWHWTLANPQPLEQPIPAKGKQGLWTPEGVPA